MGMLLVLLILAISDCRWAQDHVQSFSLKDADVANLRQSTPPAPKCLQVILKSCCLNLMRYMDRGKQLESCMMRIDIHRILTCGLQVTLIRYGNETAHAANLTMIGVYNGIKFFERAAVEKNNIYARLFDEKALQKLNASTSSVEFLYYKFMPYGFVKTYWCTPKALPSIG